MPDDDPLAEYLNDEFNKLSFAANRLTIEDFKINGEPYCSRLIFGNRYIESGYTTKIVLEPIAVTKTVLSKWEYLSHKQGQIFDYSRLHQLIRDRAPQDVAVFSLNPAPHGNFPMWGIAREIVSGANLTILHSKQFSVTDSQNIIPTLEPTLFQKQFVQAEDQFGISFNSLNYLKHSVSVIFPYQDAYIGRWRLFKPSPNSEGIRVRVITDWFNRPLPRLFLTISLSNQEGRIFFTEKREIKDDESLSFDFVPAEAEGQEVHKVDCRLFANDRCIDDASGYPLRKIDVNMRVIGKQ